MVSIRSGLVLLLALSCTHWPAAAEDEPVTTREVSDRLAHLASGPDWKREETVLDANTLAGWIAVLSSTPGLNNGFGDGRTWSARLGHLRHGILVTVVAFDSDDTAARVLAALEAGAQEHAKRGPSRIRFMPGSGAGEAVPGFRLEVHEDGVPKARRTLFYVGRFVGELTQLGAPFLDAAARKSALRDTARLIREPSRARLEEPPLPLDWSSVARPLLVHVEDPLKQPVARIRLAVSQGLDSGMNYGDGHAYAESPCRVLVPPGEGELIVWGAAHKDGTPLALAPSAVTTFSADAEKLTIPLVGGGAIAGRVLEHDGTPAAEIVIRASSRAGLDPSRSGLPASFVHGTARTDAKGHFEVIGLARRAEYALHFSRDGRDIEVETHWCQTGDDQIKIELPRNTLVRLKFVDPEGKPVPLIWVKAWSAMDGNITGVTDEMGDVILEGLDLRGTYDLDVDMNRAWGDLPPVANLHRGRWKPENGVITMEPGWTLRGTVRTPAGKPLDCTILVKKLYKYWGQHQSARDGTFEIRGLPAGPAEVAASKGLLWSVQDGATSPWRSIEPTSVPVDLVTVEVSWPDKKDGR